MDTRVSNYHTIDGKAQTCVYCKKKRRISEGRENLKVPVCVSCRKKQSLEAKRRNIRNNRIGEGEQSERNDSQVDGRNEGGATSQRGEVSQRGGMSQSGGAYRGSTRQRSRTSVTRCSSTPESNVKTKGDRAIEAEFEKQADRLLLLTKAAVQRASQSVDPIIRAKYTRLEEERMLRHDERRVEKELQYRSHGRLDLVEVDDSEMDATTNASRSVHFFEFGNGQGASGVKDSKETANTGKVDLVLDIDGSEEAEVSNGEGLTPEISEGHDASTGENFKRHKRRRV